MLYIIHQIWILTKEKPILLEVNFVSLSYWYSAVLRCFHNLNHFPPLDFYNSDYYDFVKQKNVIQCLCGCLFGY